MNTKQRASPLVADIELPPRPRWDPEETRRLARACGQNPDDNARCVSIQEWAFDRIRASEIADELGLDDDAYEELLKRFKKRNQQTWGRCCGVD